jgi:hypothetical protein
LAFGRLVRHLGTVNDKPNQAIQHLSGFRPTPHLGVFTPPSSSTVPDDRLKDKCGHPVSGPRRGSRTRRECPFRHLAKRAHIPPVRGMSKSADAEQVVEVVWNRNGSLNVRERGRRALWFIVVAGMCVAVGAVMSSLS